MKFYMESGVVASDFFSIAVPKSLYDDQVSTTYVITCDPLEFSKADTI